MTKKKKSHINVTVAYICFILGPKPHVWTMLKQMSQTQMIDDVGTSVQSLKGLHFYNIKDTSTPDLKKNKKTNVREGKKWKQARWAGLEDSESDFVSFSLKHTAVSKGHAEWCRKQNKKQSAGRNALFGRPNWFELDIGIRQTLKLMGYTVALGLYPHDVTPLFCHVIGWFAW